MTSEKDETTTSMPTLTLGDLQACGYDAVLAQDPQADYNTMATLLGNASTLAKEVGEEERHRALIFLAKICSMMLVPSDKASPFRPMITWTGGSRSFAAEDLTVDDIELLAGLVQDVKNDLLRARLADLVWMKARKKGIAYVHLAIDAYRAQPINSDTWHLLGEGCWHRALQLSLSIGAGAGARTVEIETSLLDAFRRVASADNFEPAWYVRPLYAEGRGRAEAADIAAQFEQLGRSRLAKGRAVNAQEFFDIAETWYERARQPDKRAEMMALAARSCQAQAELAGSAIVRQHWYTKAIAMYRDVPARYRAQHGVEAAIETLRVKLAAAGRESLGEMQVIKGPTIDLSDFATDAVNRVKGKTPLDALLAFCELHPFPNRELLYQEAEEIVSHSIAGLLFGGVTLAGDGRAIAKNEGASSSPEAHAAHVKSEAVKACVQITAMTAHGMVEPALDAMQMECYLTPRDFYELSRLSPLVPRDRADIVAKALHAGYSRDFVQAVHILVPQFEHMVRIALKDAGAHTTTHDENGVDMEIGLSSLVDKPQMLEVFGDNLTFTIRSILCEQEGPNLRNAVAHGLADSALCNSKHGVYVWWLVLRLVVVSFVQMVPAEQSEFPPDGATPADGVNSAAGV